MPETALRRLLGLIACLVAARYLQLATAAEREQPRAGRVQHFRPATPTVGFQRLWRHFDISG